MTHYDAAPSDRTPPGDSFNGAGAPSSGQGSSGQHRYEDEGWELGTPHELALLNSAISRGAIHARGYFTVYDAKRFRSLGFHPAQWSGLGMIVPVYPPGASEPSHYLYRADEPKYPDRKYLNPAGQAMRLDMPPTSQPGIRDLSRLWSTEGSKKADALASLGQTAIALMGVWNWRGTDSGGGKVVLGDWEEVRLNDREVVIAFDNDVARNRRIHASRLRLTRWLEGKGATVKWLELPPSDTKVGVDDFLAAGHALADLEALLIDAPPAPDLPELPSANPRTKEWVTEVWSRVLEEGTPFYVYNDVLVHLDYDAEGVLRPRPTDPIVLAYHLSEHASFISLKPRRIPDGNGGITVVQVKEWHAPPQNLAKTMVATAHHHVSSIKGIVRVPFFRPNGVLVTTPGYDPVTQLYYDPAVELGGIPENPTEEEVEAARERFTGTLLGDFTFAEPSDLAHALALMLEPLVRPMIDGPMPVHMIEAAMRGSGKGLLADVLAYVATGS